ncbi:MAG: ATPase AAA [Pirellulaceae bacterium]|nr:MAG: ATPase AAA [Pirellulaceae bacterium]
MSWQEIVGHQRIIERIRQAVLRRRIAGSYLFAGPPGIGKFTIARKLAQTLLCMRRSDGSDEACGHCPSCRQVLAGSHPDLSVVCRSEERATLSIDLFVGDHLHRNQEGLCQWIALKPFQSRYRVAIIDDADDLSPESANVLLKTLEEPPPYAVIVLIATSLSRQLPTIRSRCQTIVFQPLADDEVAEVLTRKGLVDDPRRRQELVRLAQGSVRTACELADAEFLALRDELLWELIRPDWKPAAVAELLIGYLDKATKDSIVKRRLFRHVVRAVSDVYRQMMRELAGLGPQADASLCRAAQQALATGRFSWQTILDCLEACLEADQAAQAHAHLPTLVDAWLDRLAEAAAIICRL